MQNKSFFANTSVLIILGLLISSCSPQTIITSSLNLEPTATKVNITPTQASLVTLTQTVPAQITPTPAQSSASSQPSIDDQYNKAVQAARTRLQQSLGGDTLLKAEQDLHQWEQMNQAQVTYEKDNGSVTKNQQGELVFTGQSAIWFANLLAGLKLQTEGTIKWANFKERPSQQRQSAINYVQAYSKQQVSYQGTESWIYDPLVMVEDYQSGGFIYKLNLENGMVVEIEPVQDGSYPNVTPEWKLGEDQIKAEAIIHRLAPNINWAKLTRAYNVDPGYYRWEDRTSEPLPSGQYRCVQVVFGPDNQFATFLNSLSPTP